MNDNSSYELFSGILDIAYSQFYVDIHDDGDDEYLDPILAFEEQENGLCGAAQSGKIFLVAGVQDGTIAIRVELHQQEPPLEQLYDDVVEAKFVVGTKPIFLCQWAHEKIYRLDISPGIYRVRYCIVGMDNYYPSDYVESDEEPDAPIPGQRYLLQFWPSEEQEDRIIRSTSNSASYWHNAWGNRKNSKPSQK